MVRAEGSVSARKLIQDVAHALDVFLNLDEDREIVAWDVLAPLDVSRPAKEIFADLPCAAQPPKVYLLIVRTHNSHKTYELLWAVEDEDPDNWPVVELTDDGETQVIAGNVSDWIDGLLFTCGALGGGSEDDLEDAREEATSDARAVAEDLADELDRDLANAERLGDRWDDAQETWGDLWSDAVEGIES